jgi:SAM-dependent methyltransferase
MPVKFTHTHDPHGAPFRGVCALSMLVCRGGMARAVADLADLSPNDVVVDVGCGPGSAARRAGRKGARVIGVDPSPQMLRLARWITAARHMDRVSYLEGSAEDLPLDPAGATVVWAIQSVHHWEDLRRGLGESLRVLASRGRLILMERFVTPGARGRAAHGLTEQDADELARLAGQAGFTDIERRTVPVGRRTFVVTAARAPA